MKRTSYIWVGFLVSGAVDSLIADARGLEGHLAHVREHWVDARITLPLAIAALVAALVVPLLLEWRRLKLKRKRKAARRILRDHADRRPFSREDVRRIMEN